MKLETECSTSDAINIIMNYAKIKHYDPANGEGIRISLFVSGCNFHCHGCFNPETQDFDYGQPFTDDTMHEIISLVENEHIDGLSILGGDPLCQDVNDLVKLTNLVCSIKKMNKNVWIWSGFTWEQIFPKVTADELDTLSIHRQMLIEACDIWVDGQFIESKKDLRLQWRGSSNQRVIDIQKTLKQGQIVLYQN